MNELLDTARSGGNETKEGLDKVCLKECPTVQKCIVGLCACRVEWRCKIENI